MSKKITLLGCATEYLPVIFDICYDRFGKSLFHIYKNISVDTEPELPVKNRDYEIIMHEPVEKFEDSDSPVFLGVPGPYGKRNVYSYFMEKWNIEKPGYGRLLHPSAIISHSTHLEPAVLLEPGVVVSSQTTLGFGVTVKRNSSVGHHCRIDDYVEINPGVTISGRVHVGEGSIIGSGAVIRNGITIGGHTVVGMGSVVTKNIPAGVVAFGNPCEVVRENEVRK